MTRDNSIDKILLRVAEIMIQELKLEDVTPETFDPGSSTWLTKWVSTAWIWLPWHW